MTAEAITNVNLLIDLDCVLDTRLPVIYTLHKPTAVAIMSDGIYKKRIKDVFGNIPYNVFSTYYAKRSKNILKLATPTPMLELLKTYCLEAYSSIITESTTVLPKLFINVYPYILNEEEAIILLKLFYSELPINIDIDLICKSNEELTPKFIYNNVSTFIKYDIITWLEYHNAKGNLTKCPLNNVSCVGPMLANGNKPTKLLTQEDFDDIRGVFGPLTNLVLLQTRIFSMA